MKKNMGPLDRAVRVIIAVAIGVLYYTGGITGTLGFVLLAVALIFLVTSLANYCPLYVVLGINTCRKK